MLLTDVRLPSRIGQQWQYSGIDCLERCNDKKHFASYPHAIDYTYNSRGFRDAEWPQSLTELENCIWCVGDSFTVGIGSPHSHTWPSRLSHITSSRTINVSLDGASNNWIARMCERIAQEINPKRLVVMWTYTERRELPDSSLTDEQRRYQDVTATAEENLQNFWLCHQKTAALAPQAVHFCIPYFHSTWIRKQEIQKRWQNVRDPTWPMAAPDCVQALEDLPQHIRDELHHLHHCYHSIKESLYLQQLLQNKKITTFEPWDLARDGHHFDIVTADWVAQQAACCLG